MRKDYLRVHVFLTFVLLSLFLSGPASIFGSWGLEVGRANATDVIRLQKDWLYFKRMHDPVRKWATTEVEIERIRQLLGVAEDATMIELYEKLEEYWWNNLLAPLQRIALNPAASCAEAQYALSTMMGIRRQQQLLGLKETELFTRVYFAFEGMANLRCRNEALDECVATGRFMQILQLMIGTQRQMEMLGGVGDEESWAVGALKQCAIYELHFISRTKSSITLPRPAKRPAEVETVRDGRVQIRFHIRPGQLGITETVSSLGELLYGENEKNPFFVSVKCQSAVPEVEWICSPHADSSVIQVRINALDFKHREFYVEYEKDKHMYTESEVSRERIAGEEDKFSFTFEGGEFHLQGLLKHKGYTSELPMEDHELDFYVAHRKDWIGPDSHRLKIEGSKRGVYPTVFQFTCAGQYTHPSGTLLTDSTEFELIHKPKPEPFEKVPEPIRKPLKPPNK